MCGCGVHPNRARALCDGAIVIPALRLYTEKETGRDICGLCFLGRTAACHVVTSSSALSLVF